MTDLEKTIARSASGDATAQPLAAYRAQPFKQVQQALLNLAMNAVEASAEGGTVVLRDTTAHRSVRVDLDYGNGTISESAVPRIFDLFFTSRVPGWAWRLLTTLSALTTACFNSRTTPPHVFDSR
jgi:signal transduction histidine kinase